MFVFGENIFFSDCVSESMGTCKVPCLFFTHLFVKKMPFQLILLAGTAIELPLRHASQ